MSDSSMARLDREDEVDTPAPVVPDEFRLQMAIVDLDGNVLASADEPFAEGRFDLAAARQGMRKMLLAIGAEPDAYL